MSPIKERKITLKVKIVQWFKKHQISVLHWLNNLRIMFARNERKRNCTFSGFILTGIQYSYNSVQMPYFYYQFQTFKLLHLVIPTFWISHQLSIKSALCSLCHPTAMRPFTLFHPICYVIFLIHNLSPVFKVAIWQLPFFSPISALSQKLSIFTNLSYFKNWCQDAHIFNRSCIKLL